MRVKRQIEIVMRPGAVTMNVMDCSMMLKKKEEDC